MTMDGGYMVSKVLHLHLLTGRLESVLNTERLSFSLSLSRYVFIIYMLTLCSRGALTLDHANMLTDTTVRYHHQRLLSNPNHHHFFIIPSTYISLSNK